MIDEDRMRSLLAEAADAAPPPGALPDDLLDALAAEQAVVPRPRFARPSGRVVAAAALILVLLAGVAAVFTGDRDGVDVASTGGPGTVVDDGELGGTTGGAAGDAYVSTTVPGPDLGAGGATAQPTPTEAYSVVEERTAADGAGSAGSAGGAAAQPDSALVIKTGSLTLEVKRGAYDRTLSLMTTKAAGLGGYVAQSTTSRNDGRPSGSLVLRVPASQFDGLLADLRKLGEVVGEDSRGTDVSGQHTDLAARLRSVQATRDRLGAVLAQADTVEEILAVQDRITAVQTEIEQLQGRLGAIEDQVAMASITVSLAEPGAERIRLDDDDTGLGGAWDDARRRFGDGIEGLVSWSGSAAVVLLVALAAALVLRLGWDRLRRFFL